MKGFLQVFMYKATVLSSERAEFAHIAFEFWIQCIPVVVGALKPVTSFKVYLQ